MIYAIADQHGDLGLRIPPCDLLLHAGDICRDFTGTASGGQRQEIWFETKWMDWLHRQPVKQCLATWGNHDWITSHLSLGIIRIDETATVTVDGEELNIWFSPWSKQFMTWAWMKEDYWLEQIYDAIPLDTDIIVSHQPPYGHGDTIDERYLMPSDRGDLHQGSRALLAAIDRIHPRVVICGHIHSAYGLYQRGNTQIYNVAVVDEAYRLVRGATEIAL